MGKILAVDYGEVKIGLAISEGEIASPFQIVKSKKQIVNICQEQGIDKIIVGISEGKMAEKTRKFGEELRKITGLSVEYWEETLTSKEAVKRMIEAGKGKRKRKLAEHAVAACLILQDYLDHTQNKNKVI